MDPTEVRSWINEIGRAGNMLPLPEMPEKHDSRTIVKRRGFGRIGQELEVWANYFKIDLRVGDELFQYDLHFKKLFVRFNDGTIVEAQVPDDPARANRAPGEAREVVWQAARDYQWGGAWAHDGGKILICREKLPQDHMDLEVKVPGRRCHFVAWQLTVVLVGSVDLNTISDFKDTPRLPRPTEAQPSPDSYLLQPIQALGIIFKHTAAQLEDADVRGRCIFFSPPRPDVDKLGEGLQGYFGYRHGVRPCQSGSLCLTLDMTLGAYFAATNLAETMAGILDTQVRRLGPLTPGAVNKIRDILQGRKVHILDLRPGVPHGALRPGRKVVAKIDERSAEDYFFINEQDNRHQSVAEYFNTHHRYRLRYPHLPCVVIKSRHQDTRPIVFPPEVVIMAKNQRKSSPGSSVMGKLLKLSAITPSARNANPGRQERILAMAGRLAAAAQEGVASQFSMRLCSEMMRVPARELPAPYLKYGPDRYGDLVGPVRQGHWNMRGLKFCAGEKLVKWFVRSALPSTRVPHDDICTWAEALQRRMNDLGMDVSPTESLEEPDLQLAKGQEEVLLDLAKLEIKSGRYDLLVVLLEENDPLYATIKYYGDVVSGIPTQCVVASKALRGEGQDQYNANVAMKINMKLGGSNVEPAIDMGLLIPDCAQFSGPTSEPFILLGADVSHPPPGQVHNDTVSVAAIVGSASVNCCTRFNVEVECQTARQEVIKNLKEMVERLLLQYYNNSNRQKPQHIIMYRDGVGEGQFLDVTQYEYGKIREACGALGEDYNPQITYIIITKQHNTRLFPASHLHDGRGNVRPGTVVDRVITHPSAYDFYLNSHTSIQGTSKPTLYTVLVDENGVGADAVQLFTYWLCYLYGRCTRSVGICPPCYYADLAAARGRKLLQEISGRQQTLRAGQRVPFHPGLYGKMMFA